jgi:hypothetical protein
MNSMIDQMYNREYHTQLQKSEIEYAYVSPEAHVRSVKLLKNRFPSIK